MSLSVRQLGLSIGGTQILKDVDFDASPGQVTAIVGHNGSGKTTLMRCLTGEELGSGEVTLNGEPMASISVARLAGLRGVLPQASRVAFPFKVNEVVRMGHRAGTHAHEPDVPALALQAVGMTGFEGRFYQELSGGEQQRVQLARVLAQVWAPKRDTVARWLFMDEPVASLDINHQLRIMDLARDYASRGGGVLAVMHDLNLTAIYADQVAVMKAGGILAVGTPKEVLTDAVLSEAYGCNLRMNTPPAGDVPYLLPHPAIARE